jgi:cytochrome c peroxidase
MSSQGVFSANFLDIGPGAGNDDCHSLRDSVFHVGGINTRRVEPRNTPTTINAVFNFRNFWDGRANNVFNGVNPFGLRDVNARIYVASAGGTLTPRAIALENSSLASQAVGPPGSDFEMSCANQQERLHPLVASRGGHSGTTCRTVLLQSRAPTYAPR